MGVYLVWVQQIYLSRFGSARVGLVCLSACNERIMLSLCHATQILRVAIINAISFVRTYLSRFQIEISISKGGTTIPSPTALNTA